MSTACHEFMSMTVKGDKKQRTALCTVDTEVIEAISEFMKSGTHAVQYCTCNMQKRDSTSKQGSRIMHMQQKQGHKITNSTCIHAMQGSHAALTKSDAIQRSLHRNTEPVRHGNFLLCAGFCFSDYDAVALQGSWRHAHQGTSP